MIHRDIKPQNVLIPYRRDDADGAAKLTDFGGASLAGEDALTRTGDVLGTLAYMAPEQSEGREVGEQADLYSLALVLYESLCGVNPVRGSTPAATARRIGREHEPLERRRPDLPRELTRALDDALSPVPRERGTLEELRLVLEDALEHGLRRPLWPRARPRPSREPTLAAPAHLPLAPRFPEPRRARPAEDANSDREPDPPTRRRFALPRVLWLACATILIGWQAAAGRPGVALLVLAALLPLLVVPGERRSSRLAGAWLAGVLAPALGLAGLAGAFPAIAGQSPRWRERAALAALGYWWLLLAEPLLARRLWLGEASGTPARGAWEGSLSLAAVHVIAPLLTLGVLLGTSLWALSSVVLPWLVRGRSAAFDLIAAVAWSAAILAATPLLDSGLSAHASHASPRGAVLGAILGTTLAVAARALRGPV